MFKYIIYSSLALFLSTVPAKAAQLRGSIVGLVPAISGQASISPYPASLGALGQTEAAPPSGGLGFVYLDGQRDPGRRRQDELRQRGQQFHPRLLVVPVDSDVDFPNDDPIYHNVFSYSKTKRFDLGRYGKGKSKSVHFDKTGVIRVFCDVHSDMSATIVVVDSDFIALLDGSGAFELDDVPPGSYELVHWQPTGGERRWRVDVRDSMTEVRLER
jgi:plastocyanin